MNNQMTWKYIFQLSCDQLLNLFYCFRPRIREFLDQESLTNPEYSHLVSRVGIHYWDWLRVGKDIT